MKHCGGNMSGQNDFHQTLRKKIDQFVHGIYRFSRDLPKEETYGITSQIRRAALSVALNYIEGYARKRNLIHKNFLEIAYGSLKETHYLLEFSHDEGLLDKSQFNDLISQADEIGAMLWSTISKL